MASPSNTNPNQGDTMTNPTVTTKCGNCGGTPEGCCPEPYPVVVTPTGTCDNCGHRVVSDRSFVRPTWTHVDNQGWTHYRCTVDNAWGGEVIDDRQATVDGSWDVPTEAVA